MLNGSRESSKLFTFFSTQHYKSLLILCTLSHNITKADIDVCMSPIVRPKCASVT